jgi:adenylylsulfate kinase
MTVRKATNVVYHQATVKRTDREKLMGHRSFTLWFTGLPSSGKSTLAVATEQTLFEKGCITYILDGDNVRHGLNNNLSFSPEDRIENIRRIAEVAKLFREAGVINMVAFISPYRNGRRLARSLAKEDDFIEIYVDCPVDACMKRDAKGMYQKAIAGVIKDYTGVSAPYEIPEYPEIHLKTDALTVDECVDTIVDYLLEKKLIPAEKNSS